MVKPVEELLNSIKAKIGEDTSDEGLELIEDISDTLNDLTKKAEDTTDWEAKFTENDAKWRKKYRDRFFNSESNNDDSDDEPAPKTYVKFEDLFKEE